LKNIFDINSHDIKEKYKGSFDNYKTKRIKKDLKVQNLKCFQTANNMVSQNAVFHV
jgi:hypothetical protein